MKKIIKSCDYLVKPFEFNISEQEGANSIIGGILTIIIMTFTMFYFLGALVNNFSSLNDIYAGSQSEQNANLQKQLENTLVAIEFSTDKGKVLTNITEISQYFKITGQFVQQQRIEEVQGYTRNYTTLNKTSCDKNKVEEFNFDPQAMTVHQKENLLCFDGYFNLQGQFYDPYFSYFRIMVQVCDNSTQGDCKSLEEIKNFIDQGVKIDLFVQGARILSKFNQSNPAALYSSNVYWRFNSQMADNEDIFIETIALDLKKSSLLNELFNIESFERIFSGQDVQKQERRSESTSVNYAAVLASFYLRESTDSQYYFVLQQDTAAIVFSTISQATGLCLALLEIMRFFYSYYSSHHTFESIMNNVYLFNLQSKRKKEEKKQKIKSKLSLDIQLDQILQQKISFPFLEYLCYEVKKFFKKLKCIPKHEQEEEKQTDKECEIIISSIAKKKIEADLDLSNILKKLYEIDCLKLLLLDDNQLMLFNSICKPLFTDEIEEQIEETEKMVQEVEKKSIDQLQIHFPPRINQSQTQRDCVLQQAEISKIPIEIRLTNLAWFFKSQLKLPNRLLVHNYKIIKKNGLSSLNKKLLQFTQQNKQLHSLLTKMALSNTADDDTNANQQQNQRIQNNDIENVVEIDQNQQNTCNINEQQGLVDALVTVGK